jgi:hypothetical protein
MKTSNTTLHETLTNQLFQNTGYELKGVFIQEKCRISERTASFLSAHLTPPSAPQPQYFEKQHWPQPQEEQSRH